MRSRTFIYGEYKQWKGRKQAEDAALLRIQPALEEAVKRRDDHWIGVIKTLGFRPRRRDLEGHHKVYELGSGEQDRGGGESP